MGIDLHALVEKLVTPLVTAGDSLFGVLVPVFLITFFWSFGIHGVSVVGSVARPLWEVYLLNNGEAVVSGASKLPHIAPEPLYQWFIWIGGSGATLGLVIIAGSCYNNVDFRKIKILEKPWRNGYYTKHLQY